MNKKFGSIWLVAALLLVIGVMFYVFSGLNTQNKLTYSEVIDLFEDGRVKSFSIKGTVLDMELYPEASKPNQSTAELKKSFQLPSLDLFWHDASETINQQRKAGTLSYDIQPPYTPPWWMELLPFFVVILIMGLLWVFMMNQMSSGGKQMGFTRARARIVDEKNKATFDDVAGADEEKEELAEVVDFLKDPRKYIEIGARIPKGILLVGPPGTGKTLLAKAVSGEANVPFFSISGSDFVELYVGVGASRVRDLFEQAKRNSPAIVFIDEIDAVGRHRGAGLGGGHDEREQTLNQLLVEMDGFGTNEGIIIMAATNRPDILDPALLRPGRFDRQIMISYPDVKGREAILKVHSRKKILAPDVSLSTIAKETAGFTGAQLENLLNEAALLSARRGKKCITMQEMEDAFIKVVMGVEKKSKVVSEQERKLTAYHEAGHAIVTKALKFTDPVHQISIVPRGMAGGYTLTLPKEDKSYASKKEMLDEIVKLLGGRVAEKLTLDDVSTGASNDLQRASAIARNMVVKYGMSDKLGPVVFGSEHDEIFLGRDFTTQRNYSESVAAIIDEEIKSIIDTAYNRAKEILVQHMDILHRVVEALLEKEKMSGQEFEKFFIEGVEQEKRLEN